MLHYVQKHSGVFFMVPGSECVQWAFILKIASCQKQCWWKQWGWTRTVKTKTKSWKELSGTKKSLQYLVIFLWGLFTMNNRFHIISNASYIPHLTTLHCSRDWDAFFLWKEDNGCWPPKSTLMNYISKKLFNCYHSNYLRTLKVHFTIGSSYI